MGVFYLQSFLLISGIFDLLFFALEHIQKHGDHGKFSYAHFSRYQDYLSGFKLFFKHFVRLERSSRSLAQRYVILYVMYSFI